MTPPGRRSSVSPGSSRPGSSRPGTSRPGSSRSGSSRPGSSRPGSSRAASSRPASSDPGGTRRLFVALELPDAVRAALVAFRREAADPDVWRPVADEAVHLTLAFLGRRPDGDVAIVSSVLHDAGEAAPRLVLGGGLLLPPRGARVLCASLEDPDGTLGDLQARVSDELTAAGVYVPEKRPFRAHVTVARLRPRARAPRSISAAPEPVEFTGGPLTLFESRLHPHGARYEPLVRVSLY